MEPSIEAKVEELTIEQKLEAIKEINSKKDSVDAMLNVLADLRDADVEKFLIDYGGDDLLEFDVPELTKTITSLLRTHLRERRAELIALAEKLMRSSN